MGNTSLIGPAAQGLTAVLGGKTKVQFIQQNKTIITIDASISETHSRESPATKFPIESGVNISDHRLLKPFELEIEGVISDTPLGGIGGLLTEAATALGSALVPPATLSAVAGATGLISALLGSSSPSAAAYVQLLQLQENALFFDVLTSLYRYPSMSIDGISVPRSAQNGNILLFTVKLTQLLIVAPQQVNIGIFANPDLSANNADVGSQANGIPNGFAAGYNNTTSALKALAPGGYVGQP